jgi:F-type H+-transporting ATPase subunit b
MLIDWFTVGAQALNFLVLVWLLKRFLYKPILGAIDAREKRIAAELADADTKKAEALKERDEFQHKNEEFAQQRDALLRKATDEAQAERERLLDEARQAAAVLHAQRQETLRIEEQTLHQAISRRAQQEVFAITRKALADLSETSLEERMVAVFIRRLRELDGETKGKMATALKASTGQIIIRTAFELAPAHRSLVATAMGETLGTETQLRFQTAAELIGGIEMSTDGQKVAWSIKDYLASLEKAVNELLKEKSKPANTVNKNEPGAEELEPETKKQ